MTTRNAGTLNAGDIGNTITVPGGRDTGIYAEAIRGELRGMNHVGPVEERAGGYVSLRIRVLGQDFTIDVDQDSSVNIG